MVGIGKFRISGVASIGFKTNRGKSIARQKDFKSATIPAAPAIRKVKVNSDQLK